MSRSARIIQIVAPAPGWYVGHEGERGELSRDPLSLWVLAEITENGNTRSEIRGLAAWQVEGYTEEFVEGRDGALGYFHESDETNERFLRGLARAKHELRMPVKTKAEKGGGA